MNHKLNKMCFLAQIVFFASSCYSLSNHDDKVETIHCPGGTLIYGLSISVSNTLSWPDMKTTSDKTKTPFSVCIFCKTINNNKSNNNNNSLSNNNEDESLVYQVCISQGDITQAVSQLFDCTPDDFMQNFFKNESQSSSSSSYFSCQKYQSGLRTTSSPIPFQYEAKFPSNAGKTAKQNWNSFKSDLRCATGNADDETLPEKMETQFLCGLHVQMKNDKFTGGESLANSSSNVDKKKLLIPKLSAVCCVGSEVVGLPRAEFLSSDCSVTHAAERTALIVIAILFAILLVLILLFVVDRFWFKIFPAYFGFPLDSKVNPSKYDQNGGTNGDSTLNTRPNTAIIQIHKYPEVNDNERKDEEET